MSDIQELRERVDMVEARVAQFTVDAALTRAMAAMADRDVAEVRQTMRGHTRVLTALRETQVEQGWTLAQHGEALGGLRETQVEQGRTLAQHGKKLDRHSKLLEEHSRTLATHGEKLDEHGRKLDEHGGILRTLVAGQAAIMEHLGIDPPDGGETPPG